MGAGEVIDVLRRVSSEVPIIWALVLCLLASTVVNTPVVHAQEVYPSSHPLSLPRLGSPLASSQGTAPNYDEQIGLTFTDTVSSLKYNVTAISQDNSDGYGPAYLLNGLTDKGYWYQVGLSWDWSPSTYPGTGFNMNYEAWDTNGLSVFPTDGGGGLSFYSGTVNPGDKVELSLAFSNGTVVMSSRDLNTGASASASYGSEGATTFNGLINPSDPNGYFSGLMTEEYHSSPYFGNVLAVTYSSSTPLSNGWLWVDEFSVAPRSPVFYGSKFVSFLNPSQIQTFARNGTTEYANSTTFVTGAVNEALLTLSYSVSGGGTGFAAPVLTYKLGGAQRTATLTETPTTFFADAGSNWEVANELHGSTTTERWATNKQTSGTLSTSVSEGLVYYHQYLCTFHYTVAGGGSGYSPPAVNSTVFGTKVLLVVNTSLWVDSGSPYMYASSLPGSSSAERWVVQMLQPGLVAQPESIVVPYYHQYILDMSFAVIGGGSPAAPTFSGRELGATFSLSVSKTNSFFLDSGTSWSVSSFLPGSASKERWITTQITNGTVSGPANLTFSYRHQYVVAVGGYPREGGSTSQPNTWEDAGGTVEISANASRGWRFEGWTSSGNGSYSGTSNPSSVQVNSPVVENATFYPGLQISAGSNGAVAYSFGPEKGTVSPGSSHTVFSPLGTSVMLRANPSSFLFTFSGWSQGATGTGSTTNVVLASPAAVTASFALNAPTVGAIGGAALVAALAAVFVLRRHGRSGQST